MFRCVLAYFNIIHHSSINSRRIPICSANMANILNVLECAVIQIYRNICRNRTRNRAAPHGCRAARREPAPGIALNRAVTTQRGANLRPKWRRAARAHNRAAPRDNRATRHEPAPEIAPRRSITAQRGDTGARNRVTSPDNRVVRGGPAPGIAPRRGANPCLKSRRPRGAACDNAKACTMKRDLREATT
jgi:hypothetical protein